MHEPWIRACLCCVTWPRREGKCCKLLLGTAVGQRTATMPGPKTTVHHFMALVNLVSVASMVLYFADVITVEAELHLEIILLVRGLQSMVVVAVLGAMPRVCVCAVGATAAPWSWSLSRALRVPRACVCWRYCWRRGRALGSSGPAAVRGRSSRPSGSGNTGCWA